MPVLANGAIDTSFGGKCVPACYRHGKQTSGALTDLCWHGTTSIPLASYTANTEDADLFVLQPGCIKNTGDGFCSCIEDWVA